MIYMISVVICMCAVSFRIYDVDGDGYIDKQELFQMLKAR